MFDLQDDELTRLHPARTDEGGEIGEDWEPVDDSDLDSEASRRLHAKLIGYYRAELDRQEENRTEMATDEDYYDSIQWSQAEIDELKERGQAPLNYNVVAQPVNWIIGSEKRGRSDFKVLPRRKDGGQAAERKTALLKYLSDVNWLPFERSLAFEDCVKAGLGWLECQIQDQDDGEPIYSGAESWRNIIFDSTYRRLDMTDCRYLFRPKWLDIDIACALIPDRHAQLLAASTDGLDTWGPDEDGDEAMDSWEFERVSAGNARGVSGSGRRRVRVIEAWFRIPEQVTKLTGMNSDYRGEIYDPQDERHVNEVESGRAVLAVAPMMRMHCALMTTKDMLAHGPSPYRHNRYPFTPIWGMRRARDGMPYGVIRWMRGMQDDVNKRMSKALYILSSNKVVMDEGAVHDLEEFRQEIARPDAVIEKVPGKQLELNVDRDLAPAHLELASRSISMIQQVGGVTDELLGRSTNAVSGVAVQARQEQGSVATNKLFDNLRLAFQQHGEKELSLIEQYMTEEKQFRITNQRGQPDYVTLNDGLPENDITRTKADFVIDEAEWRATMRQAATAELLDLLGKMPPEVGMSMLDLLVESMDLPNRDELVKRIRQINGQSDPDQTEPTPEEMQKKQAQAQQQQFNDQLALAGLAEQKARADKEAALARKAQADAMVSEANAAKIGAQTIREGVGAMKDATETAQVIAYLPQTAALADAMLKEAGWPEPTMPGAVPDVPMQAPPMVAPPAQQGLPPDQMPPSAMPPDQMPVMPPDQGMQGGPAMPQGGPPPDPLPPEQLPPDAMPPTEPPLT